MSNNDLLKMSPENIKIFKRKYKSCKDGGTFFFEGREVLKDYAKYIIEYLDDIK